MTHPRQPGDDPHGRDGYPLFESVASSLMTTLLVIALYAACQGFAGGRHRPDPCAGRGAPACATSTAPAPPGAAG